MADQAALRRAFADFAATIARHYDVGEVLYQLTDHVIDVLGIDGAGVCLTDQDDNLQFITATDELVVTVEQRQVESGQGPCHDAFRSGDRVTVADLQAETRWPDYTPVAVGEGLRAAAGIPMLSGPHRIGALNLYVRVPREWPADDMEDAQLLADMATGYILNARMLTERERLAAQLQHALDSRVVIEQAKGIIAERQQVTTAAAFELLRRYARNHNTKIHDIARAVIGQRLHL